MTSLAAMPKHNSYKNSGVDWIGEIPDSWRLEKAKWLFTKAERPIEKNDDIVTCFRDGQVTLRKNRRTQGFTNALKEHGYQGIRKGDLVIHAMDAFAGAIGVSDSDGKSTPVYAACIPRKKKQVNPYFYAYFMRDLALSGFIISLAKGIRERSTDFRFNDFSELLLPLPEYAEQIAIANFLDKKTAQLDEAIAIKQQQILLLKERKQVIIQQVATQGLNPDIPMRESGVDWIGDIPEHWEYAKLKYHVEILPGYAFKSEQYSTDTTDIRLLRGINVSPSYTKWNEVVYWPKNKIKGLGKYFLEEGDLVIAMDRPWISSGIRVTEIKKDDLPCLLLQRVGRIRGNKKALTAYIKLLLSTNLFLDYFGPMLTGISVPHISSEQIEDFCAPIPPVEEQEEILKFLHFETAKHDEGILFTQQQIEKLKEYKTTLINSAVTGKIKVPLNQDNRK